MSKSAFMKALGGTLLQGATDIRENRAETARQQRENSLLALRRRWQIEDRDFQADAAMDRATTVADMRHQNAIELQELQDNSPLTQARIGQANAATAASRARTGLIEAQTDALLNPQEQSGSGLTRKQQLEIARVVPENQRTEAFLGKLFNEGTFDPALLSESEQREVDQVLLRNYRDAAAEMIPTENPLTGAAIRNPVERFIENLPKDAEQAGITAEDSVTQARNKLAEHSIAQVYGSMNTDGQPLGGSTPGRGGATTDRGGLTQEQISMVSEAAVKQLNNGRSPASVRATLLQNNVPEYIVDAILAGEY